MKKILLSLGTLAVVGAIVAGATIAYYNDTETSAGNIFVAGSIDLKVDHTLQTYNGVDCKTCSVDIYSSTATKVVAASAGASNQGPFPMAAIDVSNPHPNWLPESTLAPAQWIWATDPTTVSDTTNGATYTFENKFQWNGSVATVNLDLAFASDNGYKIVLNNVVIVDNLMSEYNYNGSTISLTPSEKTLFLNSILPNGENKLQIIVRNKPLAGNPVTQNPAGLLFKLNISRPQSECVADSAFQQVCRLWREKDLEQGDTFFNFGDVKPADWGTNLLSFHVNTNDAFVCLIPGGIVENENDVVDPEITAGDNLLTGIPNGELGANLEFMLWEDNGDGVYQNPESILAGPGTTLSQIQAQMVAMQLVGSGPTKYVGLAWCAGDQTVLGGVISCNGNGMGNKAQTDSLMASLTAYAVQTRNNSGFTCASVQLPPIAPIPGVN